MEKLKKVTKKQAYEEGRKACQSDEIGSAAKRAWEKRYDDRNGQP